LIEVDGFSKAYGRRSQPAVSEISFRVNDGEIVGLAGLNGAGKTTTINAITGVVLPSAGRILVNGFDIVKEKTRASRTVGWVSEYPSFEQNAKPVLLMQYFAGFYDMPSGEAGQRITEVLKAVGLERALDMKIRSYSQGMKKRFGLASAMLSDPVNYLLDEMLNGLDPEGISYVRNLLIRFRNEGKAILLSTHILSVLQDLADRVIILHRGKVLQTLTRDSMKKLGRPSLRLKVDKVDANLLGLLSKFGAPVVAGGEVVVSGIDDSQAATEEVSAALIAGGYRLSHLGIERESLEEYFLQLTREAS
jgi:ABC-2 type transport system ATP-binding protein